MKIEFIAEYPEMLNDPERINKKHDDLSKKAITTVILAEYEDLYVAYFDLGDKEYIYIEVNKGNKDISAQIISGDREKMFEYVSDNSMVALGDLEYAFEEYNYK